MANREENIKKINEQLEQLSDEELDNVAGGSVMSLRKGHFPDHINPADLDPHPVTPSDPFGPKRLI